MICLTKMMDYKLKKKGINMKELLLFKFGSVFLFLFKLFLLLFEVGDWGITMSYPIINLYMYNLGMINNKSKSLKSVT